MVDVPVGAEGKVDQDIGDGLTIINATQEYKREGKDGKVSRLSQNEINMDSYLGRQDFSDKIPGQSCEYLPKTAMAVERLGAFMQSALTDFGNWFEADVGEAPEAITPTHIRDVMKYYFGMLPIGGGETSSIEAQLSDGIKAASLESTMTFKIHGVNQLKRELVVLPGLPLPGATDLPQSGEPQLSLIEKPRWRLRVDLIRPEDYFEDPTGRNLYKIHEAEFDLADIVEQAELGVYDLGVVEQLQEDISRSREEARSEAQRNQDEAPAPSFRKRVVLMECWGSILDTQGRYLQKDVYWVVANDRFLIKSPEPFPFWHGGDPFVSIPLIRVPHSVNHKAPMDHAVALGESLNELFNLILDGGLASVWGTRQLRVNHLENPEDISDGIPQGHTLAVKDTLPPGQKVLETITDGRVPQEAMILFQQLDGEFAAAAFTTELQAGKFPSRNVLATEVVEQAGALQSVIAGMASNVERDGINHILKKAWLTILQNIKQSDFLELSKILGTKPALVLRELPLPLLWLTLGGTTFKTFGLTAMTRRSEKFTQLMAVLQAVSNNPILLQAFFQKYSPDKTITEMFRLLGIDPDAFTREEVSDQMMSQELQKLQTFMQMSGQSRAAPDRAGPGGPELGSASAASEINQQVNPASGLTINS